MAKYKWHFRHNGWKYVRVEDGSLLGWLIKVGIRSYDGYVCFSDIGPGNVWRITQRMVAHCNSRIISKRAVMIAVELKDAVLRANPRPGSAEKKA
jgi:hypothetical protein